MRKEHSAVVWARLYSNSKTERLTCTSSKIQTVSCAQMAVTARDHGLILHADFHTEKLQVQPRNVNYLPKEPIRPAQLRQIFQDNPAYLVALPLQQRALFQQASHPERQTAPLPATTRAKPKFRPCGYVSSSQTGQRPIGRPY